MNSIIQNYIDKYKAVRDAKQEIDDKLEKCDEEIARIQRRKERLSKKYTQLGHVSWVDEIVKPLAEELAKRLNKKYGIYGPFGLSCETSIYLFEDETKSICQQPTLSITLHPRDLENGVISYETGEKRNGFAKGTLGEINGFNNMTAPLPTSIEEIINLLRHSGTELSA